MGQKFDRPDIDKLIRKRSEEMLAQLKAQMDQQQAEMVSPTSISFEVSNLIMG
jgi:hypothetical protein